MRESKNEIIAQLLPLAKKYTKFSLLFGSSTRDQMTSESDVDLAILLKDELKEKNNPTFDLAALKSEFQKVLSRDLDLIILNDADIMITSQALQTGELFYEETPLSFVRFKAQKWSQYLDFKSSRKVIEDNLLKKGWPKWKKTTT